MAATITSYIPRVIGMSSMSLNDLCKAGDVEAVRLYLQQHQQHPERNATIRWNDAMEIAARHGHMSIVQLMIERGANYWNRALRYAAEGGHMPIVQLMIERGANTRDWGLFIWDWGLCGAAQGGHMPIVQLMIERGANGWNWALHAAAVRGHIAVVQLMIERGANDWNRGLGAAAQGGHMPIVQLMIERGANDWNWGLNGAAQGGHMHIVLFMIERGAWAWSAATVKLLHASPYEVIHLSRCGHVARHVFATHSPLFEQWIREDEQVRAQARAHLLPSPSDDGNKDSNDTYVTLLPRELCELALSY